MNTVAAETPVRSDRILMYKQVDDTSLHLHLFLPAEHAGSAPPLVVFFHGGGWNGGTPAHNLHEGVPPTLILLGDQDDLIPVDTMKRFELNLTRLGVPCRLVIYPGAGHGFFNRRPEDDRFYVETLGEAIRFLEEQIGLSSP